ncbi:MAG: CocE/NonD family hydrolase [Actinomycetota bacterium]|nr:CocE/NonD family hydrolase [Actinomycetota bacterium]
MSAAPRVEASRGIPVADGIRLATDIYRPASDASVPVVLLRTPYDRKAHLHEALAWCRHGIACVVQDVRGRYDSDGAFIPYHHERSDGAATVDWLTEQEWAAGIVAYGGSYAAFTAWAVAAERPTAVSRVISVVPAMGLERVKFDPSGVLRLDDHTGWWVGTAMPAPAATDGTKCSWQVSPTYSTPCPSPTWRIGCNCLAGSRSSTTAPGCDLLAP